MSRTAEKSEGSTTFIRLGAGTPAPRQVALVAGHETPLIALDLPRGVRGQAREQVARRQLADRMGLTADMIEMRPFAPDGHTDDWTRVLIAAPGRLAALRDVDCRAILPDYLSLPTAPGLWTVAMVDPAEDRAENRAENRAEDWEEAGPAPTVMVRLGPEDGFTASSPIALALLERALADGPAPRALLRLGPALPEIEALAAARNIPVSDTPAAQPEARVLAHGELSCDLRRDPMTARARLAARVLPWRWPALAAVLAAALWGAAQIVAIDRIETRTAGLNDATRALVATHFVTSGPVLDTRVQVSRALAALRDTAAGDDGAVDPLDLAGRTATVLAAESARPETVSYRAGDGLVLVLHLTDFAAAERVLAQLRAAGLSADLAGSRVNETRAGVRTEIRIDPGEDRP